MTLWDLSYQDSSEFDWLSGGVPVLKVQAEDELRARPRTLSGDHSRKVKCRFHLVTTMPGSEVIDSRWMFEAIASDDANGRERLVSTIQGVNTLIALEAYARLDAFFDSIPATTASRHLLLAVARSSFPVRIKLSRWQPFVLRVRDAFVNRGLDAEGLLKGLLG